MFDWLKKKQKATGAPAERAGGIDPVCGMEVLPGKAASTRVVKGRVFPLCSEACAAKFDRDPTGYASRQATHPAHHGSH